MPHAPKYAGLIALLLLFAPAGTRSDDRPNIVVIISDDAGYADFGFTGGSVVPTPAIDAIATGGARLTQFYTTASVCSPSRAGFLTGRYQQRFGHHSNLTEAASRAGLGLPISERTLADHLRHRGYRTALVGKWHLGSAPELLPTRRGFDAFYGIVPGSRSYWAIEQTDHPAVMRLAEVDETGAIDARSLDESGETDFYVTDWIADTAASVIREHAGEDAPLLLIVSFTAPHTPMDALTDDLDAVSGVEPELRRTYAAMVRALDRGVGTISGAIRDTGIEDETVVMYFNDNGGATNNGSDNGRYRGMKGSKWEGGIRVPAAIRWPGIITPGTVLSPIVSSMDFTATAVALAGGPIEDAAPLDGRDLTPLLTAPGPLANDAVHDELFWERGPAFAVRRGPWKLIGSDESPLLLFHVPADPSETTNLAAQHPEVVDDLLTRLHEWRSQTVPPLWTEGERWERNQRKKHQMKVIGRDAEREWP